MSVEGRPDAEVSHPSAGAPKRSAGITSDMLLLPGGSATPHAAHSVPLSEPSMWAGIPDELDLHVYHRNDNRGRNFNINAFARIYLTYWRIDDRYPYPSLAEMARLTKRTEKTIKQYLQELLDAGLIEHVERERCNGEREMIYSLDGLTRLCRDEAPVCPVCVKYLGERKSFHAKKAVDARAALRPRYTPSTRSTRSPRRARRLRGHCSGWLSRPQTGQMPMYQPGSRR
jgi:hypothetical protein